MVKFEPHPTDNREAKVYLSKQLGADVLRAHRSRRTVVQVGLTSRAPHGEVGQWPSIRLGDAPIAGAAPRVDLLAELQGHVVTLDERVQVRQVSLGGMTVETTRPALAARCARFPHHVSATATAASGPGCVHGRVLDPGRHRDLPVGRRVRQPRRRDSWKSRRTVPERRRQLPRSVASRTLIDAPLVDGRSGVPPTAGQADR